MLLMLSRDFTFSLKGKVRSYVDSDGILRIDFRYVYWDEIMYALAYHLYDKKCCPYCGSKMRKTQLTIDHKFPRAYGGVSISNNLTPCCEHCNSIKSNLNAEEFMELRKKETKGEMDDSRNRIVREKEKIRYIKGFILPEKWVSYVDINELRIRDYYINGFTESRRLQDNLKYIEKYNHLQRPIIVDRNMWIVDGYTYYVAAKRSGQFRKVPIIKLENVELTKM